MAELNPEHSGGNKSGKAFIAAAAFFAALGVFFFLKEGREGYTSRDGNLLAREVQLVVEENPSNFVEDPITTPEVMGRVKYIWTQQILMKALYGVFGDFHYSYRVWVSVLVFLTGLSTFLLFYGLTSRPALSILFAFVSVAGYIYGVDESYGFQGIRQAIAKHNFGVFAPLILLFFIKRHSSAPGFLLSFFFMGIGVNLHPPFAISMAMILACAAVFLFGLNKRSALLFFGAMTVFVLGALPFVADFGKAFLGRGTVEALKVNPAEFYGKGLQFFANDFMKRPLEMMKEALLFPPIISLFALAAAYFVLYGRRPQHPGREETGRILEYSMFIAYAMLFVNLFVFGWALPRIIGPHALSLHRVHMVFYLVAETILMLLACAVWADEGLARWKRTAIVGLLLANIGLGFYWTNLLEGLLGILPVVSSAPARFGTLIRAGFLVFCMSALLMLYRHRGAASKWAWFAVLLAGISVPNIFVSGGAKASLVLNLPPYARLQESRDNVVRSNLELSKWAKLNTAETDKLMFLIDSEAHKDRFAYQNAAPYFKTRAIRPTTPNWEELTHFPPLRERRKHADEFNALLEALRRKDTAFISAEAARLGADYAVCNADSITVCSALFGSPVYENAGFSAFRIPR